VTLRQIFAEYQALCRMLNHDSTLLYTSPTAIATSSSVLYFIRVPTFLPKAGTWLGALPNTGLTLRVKTANGVDSGTGTPVLSEVNLLLDCVNIPEDDQWALAKEWQDKHWQTQEIVHHEPNLITTTVSGDSPKIKLEAFNGLQISPIFTGVHAARDIAASAYFNW
jgi:hypothetical protein